MEKLRNIQSLAGVYIETPLTRHISKPFSSLLHHGEQTVHLDERRLQVKGVFGKDIFYTQTLKHFTVTIIWLYADFGD